MHQLISGTISLDTWGGELSRCGCALNAMMLIFEQQQQPRTDNLDDVNNKIFIDDPSVTAFRFSHLVFFRPEGDQEILLLLNFFILPNAGKDDTGC